MRNILKLMLIFAISLFVVNGCTATSAPSPDKVQRYDKNIKIMANDTVNVNVASNKDVNITDIEKRRLAQKIKNEIDTLKVKNANTPTPSYYNLYLTLEEYSKGNAFARFLLAGLGQIRITATANLYKSNSKVSDFKINKTFAWGGLYGASQDIEDVETGFAKGVAEVVTKQKY